MKRRERVCADVDGAITDKCIGDAEDKTRCFNVPCPTWQTWECWSDCSSSCGAGTMSRKRSCYPLGQDCDGIDDQSDSCNRRDCNGNNYNIHSTLLSILAGNVLSQLSDSIHTTTISTTTTTTTTTTTVEVKWTVWSSWSDCTQSCSNGTQTAQRTCTGRTAANTCDGEAKKLQNCNQLPCRRYLYFLIINSKSNFIAEWSEWSELSECSTTCGPGIRLRDRSCQRGTVGQEGCIGPVTEAVQCKYSLCRKL